MTTDTRLILFIEDSDDDFFAAERAFKKAGLKNIIRRLTNGDQAIDYLTHRGKFEEPNDAPLPGLILLDLNLPGLDGRDVLRFVKADARLRKIPVIVLTTSNAQKDIQQCYDDGANTYVQKPVELQGFIQAITQLKEYWFEIAILPREEA
jgi:CheY-like chemotaxis protein